MKSYLSNRCFIILVAFILIVPCVQGMKVSVTPCVFRSGDMHYLEVYSRIMSESIQFVIDPEDDSSYSSSIEMLVILKKLDAVVMADKYRIDNSVSDVNLDFWDMKRYNMDAGKYNLEIRFIDLNNITDTLEYSAILDAGDEIESKMIHSDILLMAEIDTSNKRMRFDKAGFFFEPLCFNHLGAGQNQLIAYHEIYDLKNITEKECFLKYFVQNFDDPLESINLTGYKKLEGIPIERILLNIDVSSLGSGNYILGCEIYDREKKLLKNYDAHFSVFHPLIDVMTDIDKDELFESSFVQLFDETELDYALKAIIPLVGNNQTETLNLIISGNEIEPKKYFLYSFWNNLVPQNSRNAYQKYMDVARAVDIRYANNVGHGFETDRGYIFLKYGRPDDNVFVEEEPSAPPYEIWIYNYIESTQQTNVKFLFYNPSLAGNDFKLLHSTCRGELSNPNWEFELYRDAYDNFGSDGFNKNAKKFFNDF
ncbi:MAG: GWxTD domain-containing protein [Saprospiraceae bacterium]|nr:GWxTD domain-containing protein [Saprospiraceae bacterium]